ncbi:MAG: hypothetical protein K6G39_07885 [Bacteroidales bacterium]|nr:hypothetical protein [Bacteroidales bacterium]
MASSKKELIGEGVRSVFSGPARRNAPGVVETTGHENEARKEIAERRAPSVGRGRPRRDEQRDWDKSREFHTSIAMNRDQYVELTDIAYEERLPLKLAMNRLLALGIKAYRKAPSSIR